MKKNGYFRQSRVLISRYLRIFFNDKQNLALTLAIPILTIIVVSLVASGDMFCESVENDINEGYPLLSWEMVDYEDSQDNEESDDENEEKEDEAEDDEPEAWDGTIPQQPQLIPMDSDNKEYTISSAGDLQFVAQMKGEWLEKTYYLNADIDMGGKTILPLGTVDEPFKGKFEGNGHIIKNFVLETGSNCVGFFGKVSAEKAEIRNLGIEDAKIVDKGKSECVGLLVGFLQDGLVEKCYVRTSTIDVKSDYVGGVVGNIDGENEPVVRNCYSRADIKVDGRCVGGVVGSKVKGTLQYAYYAGKLEAISETPDHFGAVIGMTENGELNEDTIKCFYDNELITDFEAVGNQPESGFKDNEVVGWGTEKLKENASLIRSLDKDVEEDAPNGAFKNDGELSDFTATQTGLFMLVCVAIFVGICNSVQEVCKERNILKREYMTNLRLSSYVTSKLVVQAMVCAVQTLLLILIFAISISGKVYPTKGIIFPSSWIDAYITLFLVTFAADTTALVVSSIVKNSATANTFIPIILIVQIVFCGVLFDLGETMNKIAGIMISKWGIGALSAIYRLNECQVSLILENPELSLQMGEQMTSVDDLYVATASNLISIWLILIAFIVVTAVASRFILMRVKKDKR